MTVLSHEIIAAKEILPESEEGLGRYESQRATFLAHHLGMAAIPFMSPSQYEGATKKLPRNGKELTQLRHEHTAPIYEQDAQMPRGVLLELQLNKGYIGYNCSQAFEQTVETDRGELEKRWYIAVRTEIEGGEISRVEFYCQSQYAPTGGPPDAGVWYLDNNVTLPYDSLPYTKDETPWKPDPTLLFIRPNFENREPYTPHPDRGYDIPNKPEAHQDPSVTIGKLNGEPLVVVTAVRARSLRPLANAVNEKRMPYYQEFFIGSSISNLERVAVGPEHRKATRIVYLGDNRWGVFNRPQGAQGEEFQPGVITYAEFEAATREEFVDGLREAILDISTVIPDLCQSDEWVGPNFGWPLISKNAEDELNPDAKLKKRRIGVIGHIAAMINASTGEREYCATSFIYDPNSNVTEEVKIILTKEAFGDIGQRIDRDDLDKVIYPGGAVLLPNGKIRLYCGVSDLKAGYVDIDDPFAGLRLETLN